LLGQCSLKVHEVKVQVKILVKDFGEPKGVGFRTSPSAEDVEEAAKRRKGTEGKGQRGSL
jgi:hypothetical protein